MKNQIKDKTKMPDSLKSELLLKEIDILQTKINNYDKNILIIKGWAITMWTGMWLWILGVLKSDNSEDLVLSIQISQILILVFTVALIFFWLFEALLKYYQTFNLRRDFQLVINIRDKFDYYTGTEISEDDKKDKRFSFYSPQGTEQIQGKDITKLWRCILLRNVSCYYLFLIGINLIVIGHLTTAIHIGWVIGCAFLFIAIFFFVFAIHQKLFSLWKESDRKLRKRIEALILFSALLVIWIVIIFIPVITHSLSQLLQ